MTRPPVPRTRTGTAPRVLQFPGTKLQVHLHDAPQVEQALAAALPGWTRAPTAQTSAHDGMRDNPARTTRVRATARGFTVQSSYLDTTLTGLGVAAAACAVIADLAQDYFETRDGVLALHCGAFRYHDHLVAVTGPRRAGKSSLIARLMQDPACQIFCDDVLPLQPDDQAVALGIAPRLRLPLPARASAPFAAHVARHLGPRDDRYGYLCAPNLAPHGTTAPLGVLVVLDRCADGPARLHHLSEDEALHHLLRQNMADLPSAEVAFTRLSRLLAGIRCVRLVYADLDAAADLIRHAFGTGRPVAPDLDIGPARADMPGPALPQADLPTTLVWVRNPDVVMQMQGTAAFLWQPGQPMIWHLNLVARAIWALLDMKGSAQDMAALLAEHFPDTPAPVLLRDVNALLQGLAKDGLILRADPDGTAGPEAAMPAQARTRTRPHRQ